MFRGEELVQQSSTALVAVNEYTNSLTYWDPIVDVFRARKTQTCYSVNAAPGLTCTDDRSLDATALLAYEHSKRRLPPELRRLQ